MIWKHHLRPLNFTARGPIRAESEIFGLFLTFLANLGAAVSPIKAESEGFWAIFGAFWSSWAAFVGGEPLCDLKNHILPPYKP